MFYHKSHWNVLLKKKKIYFSTFFSNHLTIFFIFSEKCFCFHYIPPKRKKKCFNRTQASAAAVFRQPSPQLQSNKKYTKRNDSQLPFWFYKLIQSHMCYTGLELEHCKIVFLNPVIFNSWLHERTGNSNDVIRTPPTYCFFFLSSVMLYVVSCFCFIFLSFHTEVRHTEYSSYIYKRN